MRTTLDIDDRLMRALLTRFPGASKTHAIESAITDYLAADAYEGLRSMAGTLEIDSAAIDAGRIADAERDRRLSG
jgi:Arc/MetJ family transcription regulator